MTPHPLEVAPGIPVMFRPVTVRGLTVRNRIVVSPMSQYRAADGAPTDWHLVHLGKFAIGGAGIIPMLKPRRGAASPTLFAARVQPRRSSSAMRAARSPRARPGTAFHR